MELIVIYMINTHIRQVLVVSINENSCYIMVELYLAKARLKSKMKSSFDSRDRKTKQRNE